MSSRSFMSLSRIWIVCLVPFVRFCGSISEWISLVCLIQVVLLGIYLVWIHIIEQKSGLLYSSNALHLHLIFNFWFSKFFRCIVIFLTFNLEAYIFLYGIYFCFYVWFLSWIDWDTSVDPGFWYQINFMISYTSVFCFSM